MKRIPHDHRAEDVSHGLGWLSIGLGLAELLAPRQVARLIGAAPTPESAHSLRLLGLREIATGIVILARPGRAWPMWGRVAGDAVDLAFMSHAADDLDARTRLLWTTGAIAGITAVDVGCAASLSHGGQIARRLVQPLQRQERTMAIDRHPRTDQDLRDLLTEGIRDMYDAERQLTKALPKLARAATSDDLRQVLEEHLEETEAQVSQLEEVFEAMEERPRTKHCAGMAGIVEEAVDLTQEDFDGPVLDAGLIAMVQRAEHYEITAYGTCIAWAKALGLGNVASMLGAMLEEEKAVDRKLSAIAEGGINADAVSSLGLTKAGHGVHGEDRPHSHVE